jgi:hypothetical protein
MGIIVCVDCKQPSPEGVRHLCKLWVCEACKAKDRITLPELMVSRYVSELPGRYLYISEFTNNLEKVQSAVLDSSDIHNPFITIFLTEPEGIPHLRGKFDEIYYDRDCITPTMAHSLPLNEFGELRAVDPTTQLILN